MIIAFAALARGNPLGRLMQTVLCCCLVASFATNASADAWPMQPIRIIVPNPPGGTMDVMARIFAKELSPIVGQPVIVENRAGAAGNIGASYVAKASPDGYTILIASSSLTTAPSLYKSLPFNLQSDLMPLGRIGFFVSALVVGSQVPVESLSDFIEYIRAPAHIVRYGSAGYGSVAHLSGAIFNYMAQGHMTHVPYKGGAPAVLDVVSGQIEATIGSPLVEVLPHVKSGKLKLIALTTSRRSPSLPNVPLVSEQLPGYDASSWSGFWLPSGTPVPIAQKLNELISEIAERPEIRSQLLQAGVEVSSQSRRDFGMFVDQQIVKWREHVQKADIKAE